MPEPWQIERLQDKNHWKNNALKKFTPAETVSAGVNLYERQLNFQPRGIWQRPRRYSNPTCNQR
jgi:hypothetical protein